MNEFPPIASPTADAPLANAISLPALASAQRRAWVGALAHLGALVAYGVHEAVPTTSVSEVPDTTHLLLTLVQLSLSAVCAFVVGRMTSALKLKGGWIAIILSLFSIVGLFVLQSINRLAIRKLRAAGYEVGFYGSKAP